MTCVAGIDNFADLGKSDYLLYNDPVMAEGMFAYFEYLRKK